MTVLQMRDTDEETNQPPAKKLRFSSSRHKAEDSRRHVQAWLDSSDNDSYIDSRQMPVASETMVNGYGSNDPFHQAHTQRSPEENGYSDCLIPIAPLLNLGNTCFLNSVLYTLRFAPSFLHKLHHLYSDSASFTKQLNAAKQERACSLGRNLAKSGSWGHKDSYSNISNDSEMKTQAVITKLHQVYASLGSNEYKDRMDPFQPLSFLHALREVNPIFEGNQQHDAHELLVCLLDIIREACDIVYNQNSIIERQPPQCPSSSTSSGIKSYVRKSLKFSRVMNYEKGSNCLRENYSEGDMRKYLINDDVAKDDTDSVYMEERYSGPNQDTIFEDFQGISLLRTTCLECEHVTERKETFCDICVPIKSESDCDDEKSIDRLYESVIVTEEYLIDCNKYWCEKCSRLNEAKRCVRYERLPRLLTLHLKRFSSGFGSSVSKVNDYMPTPFTLSCFCEKCLGNEEPPHKYYLYAVIMHLGAAIASGHYVAYVRTFDNPQDYVYCVKDKPKTSSLSRGYSINSVSQNTNSNSNPMVDKSNSLLRYFSRKLSSKSFSNGSNSSGSSKDSDLRRERAKPTCKGAECCSIRLRAISNDQDNVVWLECDDESVRTITMEELKEMLAPKTNKNSALTPYLLFYTKA